jgi:undecaprenyl-diphosphatase
MSYYQAIFLAIVQGITEFLPVSSSGHLVIFQKIFGFKEPPIAFDALVHFGTLFSVLIFFRKDIKKIIKGLFKEIRIKKKGESTHLMILLIIGSLPAVLFGFLLKEKIESIFNSISLLSVSFLITALILFLTGLVKEKEKEIKKTKISDSIFIGLFQALAILPGVSRSGSTISGGLFRGIKKEDAFNFSFFLGIIAIFGATILQLPKITNFTSLEATTGIIGFLLSAIFGFLAIKILKPIVIKGKFYYFGIYCLVLGILCLISSI